jgi:hypothetical protein
MPLQNTVSSPGNQSSSCATSSEYWESRRAFHQTERARVGISDADKRTAFTTALSELIGQQHGRAEFVDLAFATGHRLDLHEEEIRQPVLAALRAHYRPPHYPNSADQRAYEAGLVDRYRDRLPASTAVAIDHILRQPDAQSRLRAFLEGRPANELKNIRVFLTARGRK